MQGIGAVRELAGQYDAVLCDVWGVLHDGRSVFPGAPEALIGLRAAGVSGRPADQHAAAKQPGARCA